MSDLERRAHRQVTASSDAPASTLRLVVRSVSLLFGVLAVGVVTLLLLIGISLAVAYPNLPEIGGIDRLPAEAAAAHLLGRRRDDRRVRRGTAQLRAHRRDPEGHEGGRALDRGRRLLPPPRRELSRHPACRPRQLRRLAQPGRIDHHDAGGAQLLPLHREDVHPQDLRDPARAQDRASAHEGTDPRAVHEPDLPRPARLRLRLGGRDLLRQAAAGRDRGRGGDARRAAQGAVGLQPDRQPEARDRAAALHHRPDVRERLHHAGSARRGPRAAAALPHALRRAGARRVRRRDGAPARSTASTAPRPTRAASTST